VSGSDGVIRGHEVYTGVPTSSSLLLLVLLALKVRSRSYKQSREGHVPSLWWKERMGAESSIATWLRVWGFDGSIGFEFDGSMRCVVIVCSMPLVGHPTFPFIGQRKAWVTVEEEKRMRGRSPSGLPSPSSPLCGSRQPCRCQQR